VSRDPRSYAVASLHLIGGGALAIAGVILAITLTVHDRVGLAGLAPNIVAIAALGALGILHHAAAVALHASPRTRLPAIALAIDAVVMASLALVAVVRDSWTGALAIVACSALVLGLVYRALVLASPLE
jgi:hypothetical protein